MYSGAIYINKVGIFRETSENLISKLVSTKDVFPVLLNYKYFFSFSLYRG